MKVTLITGVAGRIGSYILDYLSKTEEVKSGNRIILGIDNYFKGTKDNIKDHLYSEYFYLLEMDFRDFIKMTDDEANDEAIGNFNNKNLIYYNYIEDINKVYGSIVGPNFISIDEIYHMAAVVPTKYAYERPDLTYEVNCQGTIDLFNWARRHNVKRFVEGSSSEIYGHLDHLGNFGPNTETTPSHFDSVDSTARWSSAEGKLLVEQYLNHFADEMDLVAHLRFSDTYGLRAKKDDNILNYLVYSVLQNEDIEIFRDSWDYRRTFLDDKEAARACIMVMDKGISGAYNVGSFEEISIESLLILVEQSVADTLGTRYRGNIIRSISLENDSLRKLIDCSKIKELVGFSPNGTLREGILDLIKNIS